MDAMADNCLGRVSVPVWRVGRRGPDGVKLAVSEARIGRHHVRIIVTHAEVHFLVVTRNEAFALDLQAVVQGAVDLIEADGLARGVGR